MLSSIVPKFSFVLTKQIGHAAGEGDMAEVSYFYSKVLSIARHHPADDTSEN